jgi:hypothetical protein
MNKIKENAVSIQSTITDILEKTLAEMHEHVQKKSNILKSDRHELIRQYQEILFVQGFLREQAKEASPLEFLQLNTGHAQIKD